MTIVPGFLGTGQSQSYIATPYDAALQLELTPSGSNKLDQMLTSRDAEWYQMYHYWQRMTDVRGGTPTMRIKAEQRTAGYAGISNRDNENLGYLPKFEREDAAEYRARINTSILTDFVVRGVEAYASKPFAEEPKVVLPSYIGYMADNIDGLGTNLVQFCKTLFQETFYNALVHVMVQKGEDDNPILKLIHGPSLYSQIADYNKGVEYARYCEALKVGSAETEGVRQSSTQTFIWSVSPTGGQRFRKDSQNQRWERDPDGEFAFGGELEGVIPMDTAYSIKRGIGLAASGFWPVVDLSIKHFRALSEHEFMLRGLRSPVTAIWDSQLKAASQTQADADVNVALQSGLIDLVSTHQDFPGRAEPINYIDAAAVAESREDVESLLEQMAVRTVSVLLRHPTGGETATARAIDTAEETSELSSAVTSVELMMKKVLWFAARMVNASVVPGEIDVVFDRSFGFQTAKEAREEVDGLMDKSKQAAESQEEDDE